MGNVDRATVKTYFNTGDKPTEAQFVDVFDSEVGYFSTMQDLVDAAQSGNTDGQVFVLDSFYSGLGLGGGMFKWDASESQTNHDGVITIDPNHSSTPGGSGWWTSENTGTGCFKRVFDGNTIYASWAGAKGDNSNDDQPAIQACLDYFDTATGGTVKIGQGIFLISSLLLIPNRVQFIGAGPSAGNTNGPGTVIKATAGFSMPSRFSTNYSYTKKVALMTESFETVFGGTAETWFWSSIQNMSVIADNVDHGIAIHEFGEESLCRRVAVFGAVDSNWLLTGVHAVAQIEDCSGWDTTTGYGMELTEHPSGNEGSGGTVRFFGFSGDLNTLAHLRIDGAHRIHMAGLKSESHQKCILINGASTCKIFLTGSSIQGDAASADDFIKIEDTAEPKIVILSANIGGYTNIINDTVNSRTVSGGEDYAPGLFVYSGRSGDRTTMYTSWHDFFGRIEQTNSVPLIRQITTSNSSYKSEIRTQFADEIWKLIVGTSDILSVTGGSSANRLDILKDGSGNPLISVKNDTTMGFFNTTPASQPSLTYSRTGETTAESQLRNALATLGLVADNTTA